MGHCEKQAIAVYVERIGQIDHIISAGSTINIEASKESSLVRVNLCMCEDCHSFFEFCR